MPQLLLGTVLNVTISSPLLSALHVFCAKLRSMMIFARAWCRSIGSWLAFLAVVIILPT